MTTDLATHGRTAPPRPWPAPLRALARRGLRAWGDTLIAPGYHYQAVERWGGRLADGPLECRTFNGGVMRCDLAEHIQRHIYFFGAYEPIESFLFEQLVGPGSVVIDAGANVGQYTLTAAPRVGPNGSVHAFEPVPRNLRCLEAHVRANGFADRVRINAAALWDAPSELTIYLGGDDHFENATNYSAGHSENPIDSIVCRALRLDDYVREQGLSCVDLIKMDIEGAELFALRGARETLGRDRPTILLEINREHGRTAGYDPEAIWDELRPFGYRTRLIGDSAGSCRDLDSPAGIDRANVLFFARPLPDGLWQGWDFKSVLKRCRDGRRAARMR